ncbi:thioredoxin interacting protein b [Megalops cyprinoides]|uniref:thioredoxin interacting protein b n=1 Tax=Megalops cyprinoides TaxID=118141 RepID=UPI00186424D8|nr:thioredoxin interacting protein b [Megalops cyprinoides]
MVAMTKKVKTFEVTFSDPTKNYYSSGDKVAGRIVVEVSELTKVSAMKIIGAGCAKVEYAKGKQRCREEIEYLKYEEIVHLDDQPIDVDGTVTLRPGKRYEYIFGFELPQHGQLVSSYKGKFGYVQYYVKAVMERPSQPALECKKNFEVEEPLDVNTTDLMAPVGGTKEKKVTCMFIPDGQVSLTAKIDRKGFCEGEEICINAKFENTCSRIVVPKAAIVAKHTYQANGRTKVFRQKLTSVRGNHIISGMCDAWQGKTMRVPKIKPSILGCNIIRVEYALMIYVHIPGSDKLILELPLVIGTIPYNGFGSRTNSMSSQEGSTASNSWVSLGMPSAPPSYSDISRDYRLDSPMTPLLDDYDGSDSPIFMHAPEFQYPPPPAYTEVDEDYNGNAQMLQVC